MSDAFQFARQLGKYVVQRQLGNGANSVIYEVIDPADNKTYALKQVIKRTFEDDRYFQQAENELVIGRQIDHPVIRKIYDMTRIRHLLRVREVHLLMEMFYGETLETQRPDNPLNIVRIFRQAVAGLAAMHQAGFVHADMKPNNVLIGPDGHIKIIDLGQSCPIGAVKERIQGTPDYIAPEQVHRRPIDRRTDVFNVGATLYWALTGKHVPTVLPKAQRGRDIALATSNVIVPPERINPRVPPALSKLVLDCVREEPDDRPTDMKVLASRLEMVDVILAKARAQAAQAHRARPDDEWHGFKAADPHADTVDLADPDPH